jgi:thiosulfate dehydrogenase [quinone] large subunit
LLGASLLLGFWVRLSSALGALLMILYYLPLNFPQPDAHSYIVDQHLIYALALLILGAWQAGRFWGWDARRFRGY